MQIGVLALQGDFEKHIHMLSSLSVKAQEVREASDLKHCQGLILPGGESTTMVRQIDSGNMREALIHFAQANPIFGTCAGLILISKKATPFTLNPLGLLDIEVERNAFGRQVDSFLTDAYVNFPGMSQITFPAFFIRAPRIRKWGTEVTVLSSLYENEPILVREGHFLGATFHPELTQNHAIHAYFLSMIRSRHNHSA